jgi:CubicO group peptidase (beta-lactamase class C family)
MADASIGQTLAFVVVVDGQIVAEDYGHGTTADTTLISWSMAKSFTHAILGCLAGDGLLDVGAPARVDAWADDERCEITVQQLLNMRSGLLFNEDYVDATTSHCIDMLFGDGAGDVAGYAAALPLQHRPGSVWSYASGTTNILCRIAGDMIGGGPEGFRDYARRRLLVPLGMESATLRFDAAGTFIGSSFLYATAREFAAFGELYRNEGRVNGDQILPELWTRHAVVPTEVPSSETHGYGAHWWLWPEIDGFAAHGYEGQRILVVPSLGATIVRLGKTVEADRVAMERYLWRIIEALSTRGS